MAWLSPRLSGQLALDFSIYWEAQVFFHPSGAIIIFGPLLRSDNTKDFESGLISPINFVSTIRSLSRSASRLEPGARVGPNAVLGANCVIGAGARIDGAILWDDVTVGPGSVLRDCIVASGARIGAGAELGPAAVLGAGATVADRTRL